MKETLKVLFIGVGVLLVFVLSSCGKTHKRSTSEVHFEANGGDIVSFQQLDRIKVGSSVQSVERDLGRPDKIKQNGRKLVHEFQLLNQLTADSLSIIKKSLHMVSKPISLKQATHQLETSKQATVLIYRARGKEHDPILMIFANRHLIDILTMSKATFRDIDQ